MRYKIAKVRSDLRACLKKISLIYPQEASLRAKIWS